jgi:predicted amidohydrolase
MGESVPEWQEKACISEDGPEYEALGELAQGQGIYLSGNAYELDRHFPELYFQTSFIINDSGDVILRYRRLVSMFAPTPHDVLDAYLDIYGADSLFPVADTELGRLACVASEEILYPEITRALALKGAEVICHSSSETGSPRSTPKNIAKQARAYENMVYVVSANSASIRDYPIPNQSTDGHSQVVDYKGRVLAEAGQGETMNGYAEIDINSLRRNRAKPAMTNTLARQRLEIFRHVYSGEPVYPANTLLLDGGIRTPGRQHYLETQQTVIESLQKRGVI